MNYQALRGDSLEILKTLSTNSVDSLVTDPPAGIGLIGLDWDKDKGGKQEWINWLASIMRECHRILKPGAHGFVWAIPRTSHWTAMALEDAGFHVKDVVTHVFGSGFPKSVAIDKAIKRAKYSDTDLVFKVTAWIRERRNALGLTNKDLDQIAGVTGGACHWTALPPNGQPHIPTFERWERLEKILGPAPAWLTDLIKPSYEPSTGDDSTDDLKKWRGWGTALKPASEHWILVQKPISEHNLAANIKKFATGGININGSRVPVHGKIPSTKNLDFKGGVFLWDTSERSRSSVYHQHPNGRFPSNLLLTRNNEQNCPARIMNEQADSTANVAEYFKCFQPEMPFFYCKKPSNFERGDNNTHPTVKPLQLMRYLARMITPPAGTILDPFMGSGSTGVAALLEKFQFIGIEREEEYYQIAVRRLRGVKV